MVVVIIVITEPIETGLGEGLHGGVNVSGGRGGRCGKGGRRLSTGVAAVVDAESQHSVLSEKIRSKFTRKVPSRFKGNLREVQTRSRTSIINDQR